jgi:hypothetical protein
VVGATIAALGVRDAFGVIGSGNLVVTNALCSHLGGVFGLSIAVAVFAGAGSYTSPQAFTDGFTGAIAVSAALALLAAIAGTLLPGPQKATVDERLAAVSS